MELIDQQNAFIGNRLELQHSGWRIHKDEKGHTRCSTEETNQRSREFPPPALLSSEPPQEAHRLVTQPAAKAPPPKERAHTRPPTPPPRTGPSSSHSSHEAPPPPPGPPPPINNQIQYTPVFWSLCDIHIQPATVGDSTDDSDD